MILEGSSRLKRLLDGGNSNAEDIKIRFAEILSGCPGWTMKFWMIAHPFRRKNQEASCSEVLMWAPCDTQGHLIAGGTAASTRASGRPEVCKPSYSSPEPSPERGCCFAKFLPVALPQNASTRAAFATIRMGKRLVQLPGIFTATARGLDSHPRVQGSPYEHTRKKRIAPRGENPSRPRTRRRAVHPASAPRMLRLAWDAPEQRRSRRSCTMSWRIATAQGDCRGSRASLGTPQEVIEAV